MTWAPCQGLTRWCNNADICNTGRQRYDQDAGSGVIQELASAGRFGRALPPAEQTFLLLTDSVAKQLDALKNDASLAQPVRRFLGKGLDACGPAGGAQLPGRMSAAC